MKVACILFLTLGLVFTSPTPAKENPVSTISGNLVPMKKIAGTDLYSGIFYTVTMKKFPSGILSWSQEQILGQGANYIDIDMNPNNLPHYKPGEKWYKDVQWYLEPALDKEGYFVMRNKGSATSIVAPKVVQDGGYKHLILWKKDDLVQKYSIGGGERNEALLKPIQTDDKSEYKYQIKMFKEPEATVTWTETKYGNHAQYIQVSSNPNHKPKYEKGKEWWDDTLYNFTPEVEGLSLQGFLSHLELTDDTKTILNKYTTHAKAVVVDSAVMENTGNSVKKEPFHLNVQDEVGRMKADIILNDKPSGLTLSGKFQIPLLKTQESHGIPKLIIQPTKNLDKVPVTLKKKPVTWEIEIPPKQKTEVKVVITRMENVELPFRAMVVVTGEGDRMKYDNSGVTKGPMPAEIVLAQLKKSGIAEDKVKMVGDTVVMWVTGILKGNFYVGVDVVAQ